MIKEYDTSCRSYLWLGIMASRSFGRPVTTLAEMREAVAFYTVRAAENCGGSIWRQRT
jgi:hypothetical protein